MGHGTGGRSKQVGSARQLDDAIVVDVSVAAAWCFEDAVSAFTDAALDAVVRGGARVPALWVVEMANVLPMAERHGRLDAARVDRFLEALLALPVTQDDGAAAALAPTLRRLARVHRRTASDASYLELALRTGLPLATRDAALREAADRAGVTHFAG